MPFIRFLHQLLQSGELLLESVHHLSEQDDSAAIALITEFEQQYRLEIPHQPPKIHEDSFLFAARNFYLATQFIAHREVSSESIQVALQSEFAESPDSSIHYSIDLVFRFLPDLIQFAKNQSSNDPVCDWIRTMGKAWPLSSVGMELNPICVQEKSTVEESDPIGNQQDDQLQPIGTDDHQKPAEKQNVEFVIEPIIGNDCLLQMYVDRILSRSDKSRVADPRVAEAIRVAIGAHPALDPIGIQW